MLAMDGATAPARPPEYGHALQAYVAMVDEDRASATRNELLSHLQANGIAGRPGTHSVVGLEAYRKGYGTRPERFPTATQVEARSMALPLHNHMRPESVERVASAMEAIR